MTRFPVIVCGGRDYADEAAVFRVLDQIKSRKGPLRIIQGGAPGADLLAFRWAVKQPSCALVNMPADWRTHGRAAGPIRNQQMLDEYAPQLVVAFPGGRGTRDMVRRARAAKVEVMEIAE